MWIHRLALKCRTYRRAVMWARAVHDCLHMDEEFVTIRGEYNRMLREGREDTFLMGQWDIYKRFREYFHGDS